MEVKVCQQVVHIIDFPRSNIRGWLLIKDLPIAKHKMIQICVLLNWYTILVFIGVSKISADHSPVTFTFKEYQYKDSPKNVRQ